MSASKVLPSPWSPPHPFSPTLDPQVHQQSPHKRKPLEWNLLKLQPLILILNREQKLVVVHGQVFFRRVNARDPNDWILH